MKISYILFLLCFHSVFSQTVVQKESVPLTADRFIGIDNFKNLFFIKDRVLFKQGQDGDFKYNALQLGRITSVDIINPLKIALFFQDTNTVVLLDNKLNEIERINFNNLSQFLNAGTATTAGSHSLWVFNMDTQQLELYNYKTRTQTIVSQPFPGKVISQASNFNYCFILTEKKLRAFNVYGSFLNEINADGFERIVQQNENLLGLKNEQVYIIQDFAKAQDKSATLAIQLELPEMKVRDLYLTKDFIYIYDGKNLHTFSLTLPKKE